MDALIFAAGLGTRLGDIGREVPKALLEVGGITMLERVARAVVAAGAQRVVINVHHHAARIAAFVAAHDLGAEVVISHEVEEPLETGGGLWHARGLLRRAGPILLHNVDIITDLDLRALVAAHEHGGALATLAVDQRETARHLLFDVNGLFGRTDARKGLRIEARAPQGEVGAHAFAGIHVIAPRLLDRITERGVFSILDVYLRLAAEGERIVPFPIGNALWLEIGNPERLAEARRILGAAP
jgi:NDP-sugar pyrophosphorylase family protein